MPAERFETPKQLFLRQAAIPIRTRGTLVHRGGFEPPRATLGETGLQSVRFGRAHAPVQTWRKVDESNALDSGQQARYLSPRNEAPESSLIYARASLLGEIRALAYSKHREHRAVNVWQRDRRPRLEHA